MIMSTLTYTPPKLIVIKDEKLTGEVPIFNKIFSGDGAEEIFILCFSEEDRSMKKIKNKKNNARIMPFDEYK